MFKWIKYIITFAFVSMYFFPIEYKFLPGVNTKLAMACFGVVLCGFFLIRKGDFAIPRPLFILLMISSLVSLLGLFSVTYNHTSDYTYVTYVISAAVWLSAGFVTCYLIKIVHGRLDIPLIVNYLTIVCIYQCVMAILIDNVLSVKTFVDSIVEQGQVGLTQGKRLYGVGASLDTAGSRFSVVLVALVFLLIKRKNSISLIELLYYIFAFCLISVAGNMIARTTTVGVVLGIVCAMFELFNPSAENLGGRVRVIGVIAVLLIILIPILTFLYNTDAWTHHQLRFAFEGFFSFAETGHWHVSSNDMLQDMVVFPDNVKTWLIGDGYFNSARYDPNFLGNYILGYYMGTDIGYCRFLFYFGILGLLAMISVMAYSAIAAGNIIPEYRNMFLMSFVVGLIVWCKVSTDVFPALALYFVASLMIRDSSDAEEVGFGESSPLTE